MQTADRSAPGGDLDAQNRRTYQEFGLEKRKLETQLHRQLARNELESGEKKSPDHRASRAQHTFRPFDRTAVEIDWAADSQRGTR